MRVFASLYIPACILITVASFVIAADAPTVSSSRELRNAVDR
jgi:hypothetical protein